MLLYKIYSFFILLIMGIEDILDKGYIKMVDLLDFIVVDSNIDVYVEMIQVVYLLCLGVVSGI